MSHPWSLDAKEPAKRSHYWESQLVINILSCLTGNYNGNWSSVTDTTRHHSLDEVLNKRLTPVRCNVLSVSRCIWRWNEGNNRLCMQYNRGVEETMECVVLECSKYEHERESFMDVVCQQYGENQWNVKCAEKDSIMSYLVGLNEK
ncbi:hypothetical protein FHG87_011920 [Trinorchestia longiramus]|nr:hypothetical protein FHG87_011920 [Trinorchestia longiramus]